MITLVTILHVLTCMVLVVIVLLQTGKGADMGAVFGGGSSATLFGSSGAGNLLTRVTTGSAVVFMITSLVLAYSAAHRSPETIFDRTKVDTAAEQPAGEEEENAAAAETATGGEDADAESATDEAAGEAAGAKETPPVAATVVQGATGTDAAETPKAIETPPAGETDAAPPANAGTPPTEPAAPAP
jgi:preprotein translocase subunit SecG